MGEIKMDSTRIKIVLITITVLGIVRVLLSVMEKSTFVDILGWFALPLITILSTIMAAWFVIVSVAINLIFYDQSTTPLFTIAGIVIIAIILKCIELGWQAIP